MKREDSKILQREISGTVSVPMEILDKYPDCLCYEIEGGGMSRSVPNGATIVVDPHGKPHDGSVVVVELEDGEAYMRRLYRGNDTLLLVADGYEEREDLVFQGGKQDSVLIIGTVVWFQSCGELN